MDDLSVTLAGLSALSQETRLHAFRTLMTTGRDGMPAGAIAAALDVPPNLLSSHLNTLVQSGLVSVEKRGRQMIYRAEIDAVNALLSSLVETCCNGHPDVCGALAALEQTDCL